MDNITHTLAGLALADVGLKRTTRLGTLTLLIAVNLPDVDGFIYTTGSRIDGLSFRRGWTHGVLAMVVLPLLLAGLVLGLRKLFRVFRRDSSPGGVHPGWLLALAAIGVWSHPLLDLLNTYGVRLLMPFSSRWFYGDALFIVDPWVWGVLLSGIVVSRLRSRQVKLSPRQVTRPARVALALCATYALGMAVVARVGAAVVEGQAGAPARRTLAAPVFGNPFHREVIRELEGKYELGELTIGSSWRYRPLVVQSRGDEEPGAGTAATTPLGAAFLRWSRFPSFSSVRVGDTIEVSISDLRYGGRANRGWASVTVLLPGGTASAP